MFPKSAVVDEDLPRIIDAVLEGLGWTIFDVRDIGLKGEPDENIISFAKRRKAVLFSGDWGFANILKFPPKDFYGIVILNFPNELSTKFIAEETARALIRIPFKDFRKHLIIIEPGKVRIRG